MVVVEYREDAVAHGMIAATGVNVDGEDDVDNGEDEEMELLLEEVSQAKSRAPASRTGGIVL